MVAIPIIQAIIIGVASIAVGFFTIAVNIWRYTEDLSNDEDTRRIEDLQGYRRGELSTEIKDLYLNIEQSLEQNPYTDEPDREYEVYLSQLIRNDIEPSELNSLVERSENVNQPSIIYEEHESEYHSSYMSFAFAGALLLGVILVMVVALTLGEPPLEGTASLAHTILFTGTAVWAYNGLNHFLTARDLKNKFDEEWRDYRYRY